MATPVSRATREVAGACQTHLDVVAARYAPRLRAVLVGLCCCVGAADASQENQVVAGAVAGAVVVWPWFRAEMPRLPTAAKLSVDAVLAVALGLTQLRLGVQPPGSWFFVVFSVMVGTCHFEWPGRWRATSGLAGMTIASYAGGYVLAGGDLPVEGCARLLVESAMAALGLLLLRRVARRTDLSIRRSRSRRVDAAVARAGDAAERAHLAVLHDTASTTFLMVSTRGAAGDLTWVPDQARRALQLLPGTGTAAEDRGDTDLVPLLHELATHQGLRVQVDVPPRLSVPTPVALAIHHGVLEALTNVRRHAGDDAPFLSAGFEGTEGDDIRGVVVEVRDSGAGFDLHQVPADRRGLSESIVRRAAAAGVRACLEAAPGAGTTVRWTWTAPAPAGSAPLVDPAGGRIAGRIEQSMAVAVRATLLAVAVAVQFLLSAPAFLGILYDAGAHHVEIIVFAVLATVAVGCTVDMVGVVRRTAPRSTPATRTWVGVGALLACSLAISPVLPLDAVARSDHWSFGLIGWYALILLLDSSWGLLVGFLGVHLTVYLTPVVLSGPDLQAVSTMGVAAISVAGLQAGVGLGAGVLATLARTTVRAARTREQAELRARTAQVAHDVQQRRHAARQGPIVALLRGLASGVLDPTDEAVRRRCAVEAARIRRWLCVPDDAADTLLRELDATIHVAERHGIAVHLSVVGDPVHVPESARRVLLAPVTETLLNAATDARVTVLRTPPATVRLSITSRGLTRHETPSPLTAPPGDNGLVSVHVGGDGVDSRSGHGGGTSWLELTWTGAP